MPHCGSVASACLLQGEKPSKFSEDCILHCALLADEVQRSVERLRCGQQNKAQMSSHHFNSYRKDTANHTQILDCFSSCGNKTHCLKG